MMNSLSACSVSGLSKIIEGIAVTTDSIILYFGLIKPVDFDYRLIPSVGSERLESRQGDDDVIQMEKRLLFEIRPVIYKRAQHAPLDEWEELALANNLDCKTRFMKWTTSPLAALYIAASAGDLIPCSSVCAIIIPPNRTIDHRGRSPAISDRSVANPTDGLPATPGPFDIQDYYAYLPASHISSEMGIPGGAFLAFPKPRRELASAEIVEIIISPAHRLKILADLKKHGHLTDGSDSRLEHRVNLLKRQQGTPPFVAREPDIIGQWESRTRGKPMTVLVITALPIELSSILNAFGLTGNTPEKASNGTNFWRIQVPRMPTGMRTVMLACIGTSGNVSASAATAALIGELHPGIVIMIGIAAGMRDKCKLGDVLIAERVVSYEIAAQVKKDGISSDVQRPETYRTGHAIQQDVVKYLAASDELRVRLNKSSGSVGLKLPTSSDAGPIVNDLCPRMATIASGEKLFRDPDKFTLLRHFHGKIEAAEMEAVGIVTACEQAYIHHLIIRGISDFGDEKKDDRFHNIAATASALVAADFIRYGLNL